jgi:hypothetical protein
LHGEPQLARFAGSGDWFRTAASSGDDVPLAGRRPVGAK